MSKVMQGILFVGMFMFAVSVQAGVALSTTVSINSQGQDVATITATSDGAPITSLGINISGAGNISQVHPAGFDTPMQNYNPFFGATPVDHDTQAMFVTESDAIWMPPATDTTQELDVNFTGFTPFQSKEVLQVVLRPGGLGIATIGVVAGGVEYTVMPPATFGPNGSVLNLPEPASLGLLTIGCIAMIRRR